MRIAQNSIFIFIWTFLLLNLRPSLIGQSYNPIVFALFIPMSLFILFKNEGKIKLTFSPKEFLIIGIIGTTFLYFLLQGLILSNANRTVINSVTVMTGSSICIFFILRNPEYRSLVVKHLINIHYYLSISQIITFLIFIAVGFDSEELPIIANFQQIAKYYYGIEFSLIHYMVFPFTITWSAFDLFGIHFYRTCGLYREPGMAQIFYLTTFFFTFFYKSKNIKLKRIVILIGSILILSASGFLNLILGLFLYFIFNKMHIRKLSKADLTKGLVAFALLLAFSIATFNVVSNKFKFESGAERMDNITQSLSRLAEHPIFGQGYYFGFKTDGEGIVVSERFYSFLGVFNQIGLVGIILYFACWIIGLKTNASTRTWCIYLPCLLSLLSSQPSYNDVFTWFLLLFDTSRLYSNDT